MRFSIVIVTFNRSSYLFRGLALLQQLPKSDVEIIVVDNGSGNNRERMCREFPGVKFISDGKNYGPAEGRNIGNKLTCGEIVLNIDDDVFGIQEADLNYLEGRFRQEKSLGAICFKVVDANTGLICNWSHHRSILDYQNLEFETLEISEGAVAFCGDLLRSGVLYPVEFFISHEGVDVVWQLLHRDRRVLFTPNVVVSHEYAEEGRVSWRRYYYDTRNLIWLAVRRWPIFYGIKNVGIGLLAMAIYSIRDGFFTVWLKAVFHGVRGAKHQFRYRTPPTKKIMDTVSRLESHYEPLLKKAKDRFFKRDVRI